LFTFPFLVTKTFAIVYNTKMSRTIWWRGRVACMGDIRNVNKILVGEPEEK